MSVSRAEHQLLCDACNFFFSGHLAESHCNCAQQHIATLWPKLTKKKKMTTLESENANADVDAVMDMKDTLDALNAICSKRESNFGGLFYEDDDIVDPDDYNNDADVLSDNGIVNECLTDLVCVSCCKPLVFAVGGDALKCASSRCSHHSIPVTDPTITSLPFDSEVFFTATFAHMTAVKPNQPLKKQSDIFGKTNAPLIDDRVVDYIRRCIIASTNKKCASEISIDDVFACLKTHGWKQLYNDKLVHLFCKVTHRELPILSQRMFQRVHEVFRLARKAYLSCLSENDGAVKKDIIESFYGWLKVIELVGAVHIIPYIRRIDPKHVDDFDSVWMKICQINGWLFIPTAKYQSPCILPLIEKMVFSSNNAPVLSDAFVDGIVEKHGKKRAISSVSKKKTYKRTASTKANKSSSYMLKPKHKRRRMADNDDDDLSSSFFSDDDNDSSTLEAFTMDSSEEERIEDDDDDDDVQVYIDPSSIPVVLRNEADVQTLKRRRGRPSGSKNKTPRKPKAPLSVMADDSTGF